ncbi:phosphate transporter PHO1-2-like isoform X2 [Canna indica]|uniref:Phosphate transporter PHO1-2-like isoform X2 n=1 Tax=Canna indica TaxID=4628 RepID=A0AAQ3L2W1_9LILI|nr:phosphate transporter PHO1-2-like isoform X2 [Canna indica]
MVKFSRELEAKLVPEWKDAFVDYRQLKKNIKKIKLSFLRSSLPSSSSSGAANADNGGPHISLFDPVRTLAAAAFSSSRHDQPPPTEEESLIELTLVQSTEDEVREFFENLEKELNKVNGFYTKKEREFCELFPVLNKQLQILLDLKQLLHEHNARRRSRQGFATPPSPGDASHSSLLGRSASFTDSVQSPSSDAEQECLMKEVIAAMERNGVRFIGSTWKEGKKVKEGRLRAAALRIDIPATTPTRAISLIWEDLANGIRREKGSVGGGDYVNRKKVQRAEKMIRDAFLQLHRGLGFLKSYSSLNMEAFQKILKKFEKVIKVADEVERIFIKHFAGSDRKKAMKFLRPKQPNESYTITFLVGLFTGTFLTLFTAYGILAHVTGIFSASSGGSGSYLETVYPIFSMFALISLHIFLYGCSIYAWTLTRISHNFIFDFNPSTALKHRDAFLVSAVLMTALAIALLLHLLLQAARVSKTLVDAVPGAFLLLLAGVLICPLNIFYRSTRFCFIRVMRNIVFSPLYRVLMVDFFMADQLTSQIPLLRHMESTACYFMAARLKMQPYETCTRSLQYKLMVYTISFLPYFWRAMQCLRRYFEEGYDSNHLWNAGKYVSAMVAAAARGKYAVDPTPRWLAIVVVTSTGATFYQLFWDFVMDWGLLDLRSENLFLRDQLILKNKCIYYFSIVLNFVLRLAWIESVMRFGTGQVQFRLLEFSLASLEVVRRGHWNFYRLENEHLNNAGKFRAVRAVPLPFSELLSDG